MRSFLHLKGVHKEAIKLKKPFAFIRVAANLDANVIAFRGTQETKYRAAKRAGWLPSDENKYPKTSHVGFGLVLGVDGKRFKTRSTEVVKLVDLRDEAKIVVKQHLWTEDEFGLVRVHFRERES
ncbi:hypothetical protein QVD17_00096 [Tagetes erecta]|uniref:Arginyl-tRNA synthetase catalytic core domain-containing protein n=1 Tax=Tagetes erecta TaxID=13708 RepID=A0AAD8P6X1_TARER|nr:hypothetical protein QVD17_00096 [Tagetes erecta]